MSIYDPHCQKLFLHPLQPIVLWFFSCLQYCLTNSRLLRLSCTYLPGMYSVCDSCITSSSILLILFANVLVMNGIYNVESKRYTHLIDTHFEKFEIFDFSFCENITNASCKKIEKFQQSNIWQSNYHKVFVLKVRRPKFSFSLKGYLLFIHISTDM